MKIVIIKSFADDYDCDHLQSDEDINPLSCTLTKKFLNKDGVLFHRLQNQFHLVPNIRIVLKAEHRERILSDSRMFLCPIPIQNGIAYTGTSGFRRPTLGVYIEWLLNCPNASMWNEGNGEKWIVYHLSGSPLSGCNRCGMVNQQGETKVEEVSCFSSLWPKFQKINCRYDEAKVKYQAYNIREVLAIFEKEGKNVVYDKDIYLYFLERANHRLKNRINTLTEYGKRIYKQFHQTLMLYKKEECKAFLAEYHARKEQADRLLTEIQETRLALRKRLKRGELSSKEYQKMWTPFGKERNQVKFETNNFVYN